MSPTAHRSSLKKSANTAAANLNDTIVAAVALTGLSAALVPHQWHQPNIPPTQNDNSAGYFRKSARQFSENDANFAAIATFPALFV